MHSEGVGTKNIKSANNIFRQICIYGSRSCPNMSKWLSVASCKKGLPLRSSYQFDEIVTGP